MVKSAGKLGIHKALGFKTYAWKTRATNVTCWGKSETLLGSVDRCDKTSGCSCSAPMNRSLSVPDFVCKIVTSK